MTAARLRTLAAALLLLAGPAAGAQRAEPAPIRRGALEIHAPPAQRPLALRLLEVHGLARIPGLPADALERGDPVRIYLAPDEAAFRRLTGGVAPEWGAGIAFPDRGIIVLPAYASHRGDPLELAGVLRHELAHVALERYLDPARIPRWFHEGFARWAAGEFDVESAWMLRLAFALHRAPPLDSLRLGWPEGAADARVAYLLAASTVRYLAESGGEYGIRRLLERWRESGSLDAAMRATYGVTLGQFEEDWKQWVKDRYGWALFLSNTVVFWGFATLLLLVLYAIRRRRDRQRLERLREEEPPDRPAYWLGETVEAMEEDAEPRRGDAAIGRRGEEGGEDAG